MKKQREDNAKMVISVILHFTSSTVRIYFPKRTWVLLSITNSVPFPEVINANAKVP